MTRCPFCRRKPEIRRIEGMNSYVVGGYGGVPARKLPEIPPCYIVGCWNDKVLFLRGEKSQAAARRAWENLVTKLGQA